MAKKSNKSNKSKKYASSKVIMYVQQCDKLPFESKEALIRRIKNLDYVKRYAVITHDKDKEAKPHVHVVFRFDNKVSITKLAKDLNEPNQAQFEIMTKRGKSVKQCEDNVLAYLTHKTKNAKKEGKHQYDPEKVTANFDYCKHLKKIELKNSRSEQKQSKESKGEQIDKILKQFADDEIGREETVHEMRKVDSLLTAKKIQFLDKIEESKNLDSNYQWKQKKHKKYVLWFYGNAGTGKTSEANHILKNKYGNKFFETGGNRDIFENYSNEHGILIDDFRVSVMDYNELLKMLDPYKVEVSVSSRYHNKELQGELYIVTCPYNPVEFYKQMGLCGEDTYDQLARRINMIVHFEKDKIKVEHIRANTIGSNWNIKEKITPIDSIDNLIGKSIEDFYHATDQLLKNNFNKKARDLPEYDTDSTEVTGYEEPKIYMSKGDDGTISFEKVSLPKGVFPDSKDDNVSGDKTNGDKERDEDDKKGILDNIDLDQLFEE
ncbi:Rep family protein [Ligilactobacillus sp. LYQ135]